MLNLYLKKICTFYIVLIVSIIALSPNFAFADEIKYQKINLSQFIQNFLKSRTDITNSLLKIKKQNLDVEIKNDLNFSSFYLSPYFENNKITKNDNLKILNYTESGYLIGIKQNLFLGTQIDLNSNQIRENSRTQEFANTNSYKLEVSQPLLKNGFGKVSQTEAEIEKLQLSVLQTDLDKLLKISCLQGVELYLKLWVENESLSLVESNLKIVKENLKLSEGLKKKGLISDIDLLNNQIQLAELEKFKNSIQQSKTQIIQKIFETSLMKNLEDDLASPEREILLNIQNYQKIQFQDNHEDIKKLKYLESINELNSARVMSSQKPELNFVFSKSLGQGTYYKEPFNNDLYRYGLNFTWKFNDVSIQNEIKKSKLELEMAKNNLLQGLNYSESSFYNEKKMLSLMEVEIEQDKIKADLSLKLVKELIKKYNNAKLEYQDVLRAQDQLIQTILQKLKNQENLWILAIQHIHSQSGPIQLCQVNYE